MHTGKMFYIIQKFINILSFKKNHIYIKQSLNKINVQISILVEKQLIAWTGNV